MRSFARASAEAADPPAFRPPRGGLRAGALIAACVIAACTPQLQRPEAPAPTTPPPPPPASAPQPPNPVPPAPATEEARPSEPSAASFTQRGLISLYGDGFDGKTTASGERFDADALTMAHRTLPFGTRVRVTNLENHKSVEVVVNDRGPHIAGRIADLSAAAAKRLGMVGDGVVEALLEVVGRPKRH